MRVFWCHCKPDAIHQEQCRLIADLALPFNLKSRYALFTRASTPERIAPVAKRNPRFFVHCADSYGVLLFAIVTTPQITLIALACFCILHLVYIHAATADASGSVAPTLLLKKLDCRFLIGTCGWNLLYQIRLRQAVAFVHVLILYITQPLRQV